MISTDDLGFTDPDDDAANVTFTVGNLSNGEVRVGGVAVSTFTGAQLVAGDVSFVHDDSETTTASFEVSVEDANEDDSTPVAQTFNFAVTAANDAPLAAADDGTIDAAFHMSEDDGSKAFNVRANDTLDQDASALNNVTLDAISVQSNALGIDADDLSITVDASNNVDVQMLGTDWDKLAAGQTLDIVVPYTLHGDLAGDTSTTDLTVQVSGVNDAPFLLTNSGLVAFYDFDEVERRDRTRSGGEP